MAQAEIRTRATLDGKGFQVGIAGMKQQTQGFASQLAGMKGMIAGAFSVGAVVSFGRKLLETGDTLDQAAKTFGISLQSMIALKSAMAETGISSDKFLRIFGKLNSTMADAKNGSATAVNAFKDMNVTQLELAGLSMDKVIELLAKKYGEAGDKAEFLNGVSGAFGDRIGPQLIDVFQRINNEGMAKFTEGSKSAADGMSVLATASNSIDAAGSKFINKTAAVIGILSKLKTTLLDVINEHKSFKEAWRDLGEVPSVELSDTAKKRIQARSEGVLLPGGRQETDWEQAEQNMDVTRSAAELTKKYADEKAKKEAEEARKKTEKVEDNSEKERAEQVKAMDHQLSLDEKRHTQEDKFNRAQDELATQHAEKYADIMSGKGIEVPGRARVDSLQAIGGIIGGVAGRGDQAARIAERAAKSTEAIQNLMLDTNRKFEELNRTLDGIINA